VIVAADGEEGLRLGEANAGRFDLLLTDVVMPGMSGRELAQRLTAVQPEIKVIFISGYTDDAVLRRGVLSEGVSFLQKPFTIETLARKISEVLTRAPHASP
jgi:CheY-like chemotaxis protein